MKDFLIGAAIGIVLTLVVMFEISEYQKVKGIENFCLQASQQINAMRQQAQMKP
jgi:cell division protein ZapA (FtsZ GTPase activity inhibitor)